MDIQGISLAIVVFIGNWLVAPLFFRRKSFTDGFAIGLISAVLFLVFYKIFK